MTKLTALLSLALVGCATDGDVVDPDPGRGIPQPAGELGVPGIVPLVADMCDEPRYEGTSWHSMGSAHFTVQFLPGTAAARDATEILDRLEAAYVVIRGALGVETEPMFTVTLSPSRNAALAHGNGFGVAYPNEGRYEVIYTGARDGVEMHHYGKLLTQMLDYHVTSPERRRVPMLATGLTELLDQSGRDLHAAYASQLASGTESRVRLAEMDAGDITGANPGRAGSLVQFLVQRYGIDLFRDIYSATAVKYINGCYYNAVYGCISTPDELTSMLDGFLVSYAGEHWADVQPDWEAAVEHALAKLPTSMPSEPEREIANLLRVMDHAINTKNAFEYRTAIEGFYCDAGGDAGRSEIASRTVWAYDSMSTQLLALYDTGTKNFPTAEAVVMRTDSNGQPSFAKLSFEHMPVYGWRVSASPDWE